MCPILSPKFMLECLKHISFQYSFGSMLVCIAQLIAYTGAAVQRCGILLLLLHLLPHSPPFPPRSRTIGNNASHHVYAYAIAFTMFSVISHLFFGSHLKLAYSMVGLRGAGQGLTAKAASKPSAITTACEPLRKSWRSCNEASSEAGRRDWPLSCLARAEDRGWVWRVKNALAGAVQATSGVDSSGIVLAAIKAWASDRAQLSQLRACVVPSCTPVGRFQRASQNLLCRCLTPEREASFVIKLYMAIECVILSALQLALSAAPYASKRRPGKGVFHPPLLHQRHRHAHSFRRLLTRLHHLPQVARLRGHAVAQPQAVLRAQVRALPSAGAHLDESRVRRRGNHRHGHADRVGLLPADRGRVPAARPGTPNGSDPLLAPVVAQLAREAADTERSGGGTIVRSAGWTGIPTDGQINHYGSSTAASRCHCGDAEAARSGSDLGSVVVQASTGARPSVASDGFFSESTATPAAIR